MATNDKSILLTTKSALGLAGEYDPFDDEIVMHINSVLGDLNQLGVGPVTGFEIEDDTEKWKDFIGETLIFSPVKSYVYQRVKLLFDPPQVGFVLTSMKEQIDKAEWRINVIREEALLALQNEDENPDDPTPTPLPLSGIRAFVFNPTTSTFEQTDTFDVYSGGQVEDVPGGSAPSIWLRQVDVES